MGLNSKSYVSYIDLIGIGTVNQCSPSIREIFKMAYAKNAASLIISHNHPSGDPEPSYLDEKFTKKVKEAADLLQFKLLDHIIIGNGPEEKYYSFLNEEKI